MRLPGAGAADLSSWPEFKEHLDEFVEDKSMERCALKNASIKRSLRCEFLRLEGLEVGGV